MSPAEQLLVSAGPEVAPRTLVSQIKARWRQGEPADARAALDLHRELRADRSAAMDLAYEEFNRRRGTGEDLDPEAFCRRFPAIQSSLRRLVSAHLLLEENPELLEEPPPARWPEPGETFLGFTLLRELGRGAFARVFLATEEAVGGRLVALKVAPRGGAEARTLGKLKHPNVVEVYSVWTDESSGLTAVCMPYEGGATLCDVLDLVFAAPGRPAHARALLDAARLAEPPGVPSPAPQRPPRILRQGSYVDGVLHLAVQLAAAVRHAHEHGIEHRDLKPTNVLVRADGRPMLLDFNLSHDCRDAEQLLGGTLPYMAPEQLRAAGRGAADGTPPDARADLFSLGVLLYELRAGTHPFGPVPVEMGDKQLRALLLERQWCGARPLREVNPDVDRGLGRLIERCLVYDPAGRLGSAAELEAGLRRCLSPARRLRRWAAQHPWRAAGSALLLLALGLFGVFGLARPALSAARAYEQGVAAYRGGQFKEAARLFSRALEADPGMSEALFGRGRAYQQLGDREDERYFAQATADYIAVDRLAPSGKVSACWAYCLSRQNQHDVAIREYKEAVKAGLSTAGLFNNLGYSYHKKSMLPEARAALDQAIARDERLGPAYHNRALLAYQEALKLGQDVAAAEDLERCLQPGIRDMETAVRLGPAGPELYLNAARLYALAASRKTELLGKAAQYLGQAVDHGAALQSPDPVLKTLQGIPAYGALLRPALPDSPAAGAARLVDPVQDCCP
jgi:serine/threonine protein kinase/Tfp pilus assembly protein PilF